MSRNGSGTYNRAVAPYVAGTTITAATVNSEMDDIATALTQSLSRDGQSPPTANIPMGGFRITGLANAIANTDAAPLGQVVAKAGDTMTGALGVIAGTAAAPGMFVSGDTNTGFFRAAAAPDTLSISAGGTEVMRFDGTGANLYNNDGQVQFFNAGATVRGGYIRNIIANTRFEFLADQYSMRIGTLTARAIEFLANNAVVAQIGASGGLVLGSPTGGDLGGGVLNATDVRVNNVSRAPLPQAAVGVGQFSHFNSGVNTAAVLPSGGTWAWWLMQVNSSGTIAAIGSGFNAGGTTIQAAVANVYSTGFWWRIA